jgi:DNA-binding transcriptional MerR regulator
MPRTGKYTAEQLAQIAGVPLRTVRYYVQEKLIDEPLGLGRGSHFDEKHLDQLKRIKLLQLGGFDLEEIRRRGGDIEKILNGLHLANLQEQAKFRALFGSFDLKAISKLDAGSKKMLTEVVRQFMSRPRLRDDDELDPDTAVRVPMAKGVELLVDPDIEMPSPKDLVEIALLIRKLFGER